MKPKKMEQPGSDIELETINPLIIIILIWVIFLLNGTFSIPLMPPDEPKYAASAEYMLQTGDFITPYFNCQPRFDKPPMIYWLTKSTGLTIRL
jgi:4-amino-4-deoxy-L-arabinose transferase-like glycosyltransferase